MVDFLIEVFGKGEKRLEPFIDFRHDPVLLNELTLIDHDQYLLTRVRQESSCTMRFFSIFDARSKTEQPINAKGVPCNVGVHGYSYLLDGDCLLTDVSQSNETSIYSINVTNGTVKQLICMPREVDMTILDGRYVLLHEDLSNTADEAFDLQKDIRGDYQRYSLLDLTAKKEYSVNDAKLRLGFRDHLIPFRVKNKIYLLFEEAYMDDYELEDAFNMGIKKDKYFNHEYRESINVITLEKFVEAVKADKPIPFKVLHQTEWSGNTRYVGMNETEIFYLVRNFANNMVSIYSSSKQNFATKLIRIFTVRKDLGWLNHDVEKCLIYQEKLDKAGKKLKLFSIFQSKSAVNLKQLRMNLSSLNSDQRFIPDIGLRMKTGRTIRNLYVSLMRRLVDFNAIKVTLSFEKIIFFYSTCLILNKSTAASVLTLEIRRL
jgi:hypothetical protein